jgi:endonuclease/exonuclease/phosphatase family metal-dependent hydrolase
VGSIDASEFTLGSFNAHWGMAYFGALAGQRYDVVAAVRGLEADVVVVPESWRTLDGVSMLEPLAADGYTIETLCMTRLHRPVTPRRSHPGDGFWELAICTRFPVVARCELPIGSVLHDPASPRRALACTLDVNGTALELVAVHTSSKLWYGGPVTHLRGLARHLPVGPGPAVVAGDCNLWGPGVVSILRGWRRAVRGRSWPAKFPHSQIDHILVNDQVAVRGGEVLAPCHSDHRPVRAHLSLLT